LIDFGSVSSRFPVNGHKGIDRPWVGTHCAVVDDIRNEIWTAVTSQLGDVHLNRRHTEMNEMGVDFVIFVRLDPSAQTWKSLNGRLNDDVLPAIGSLLHNQIS
jgi:hypothetical protein